MGLVSRGLRGARREDSRAEQRGSLQEISTCLIHGFSLNLHCEIDSDRESGDGATLGDRAQARLATKKTFAQRATMRFLREKTRYEGWRVIGPASGRAIAEGRGRRKKKNSRGWTQPELSLRNACRRQSPPRHSSEFRECHRPSLRWERDGDARSNPDSAANADASRRSDWALCDRNRGLRIDAARWEPCPSRTRSNRWRNRA